MLIWLFVLLFLPPLLFYIFITGMAVRIDPGGEKLTENMIIEILWHTRAYLSYLLYYWIYLAVVPPVYIYKGLPARRGGGLNVDHAAPSQPRAKKTIILIHGFMSTPIHWFIFRKRLERLLGGGENIRVITFGYNSFTGSLDKWVEDLEKKTRLLDTDEVIFAGHSLGGLISLWAASSIAKSAGKVRVKVVTFGTPFYGTKMARFSVSANGRRLQPGMPLIVKTGEMLREGGIDLTGYWSLLDRIIIPHSSAAPKTGKAVEIKGMSHTGYFFMNPDIPEFY
jgi:pimeloyl-ACP methyl ester carboxylesterase